MNFFDKEAYSN